MMQAPIGSGSNLVRIVSAYPEFKTSSGAEGEIRSDSGKS